MRASDACDLTVFEPSLHHSMRAHGMAIAAIFGNASAAPEGYFGNVDSSIDDVSLTEIRRLYGLGMQRPLQARDTSSVAMLRH